MIDWRPASLVTHCLFGTCQTSPGPGSQSTPEQSILTRIQGSLTTTTAPAPVIILPWCHSWTFSITTAMWRSLLDWTQTRADIELLHTTVSENMIRKLPNIAVNHPWMMYYIAPFIFMMSFCSTFGNSKLGFHQLWTTWQHEIVAGIWFLVSSVWCDESN